MVTLSPGNNIIIAQAMIIILPSLSQSAWNTRFYFGHQKPCMDDNMKYFSHKHNWHLLVLLEYVLALFIIDHVIWNSEFLFFSSQTCLLSSVVFFFYSIVNDDLWLLNLVLKLVWNSQIPIYDLGLSRLLFTVALYTTLFIKHFPANGQSACCLQLQRPFICFSSFLELTCYCRYCPYNCSWILYCSCWIFCVVCYHWRNAYLQDSRIFCRCS